MTDRSSSMVSGFGIAVAMVGSAAQNLILSWAGPLLALAVHLYGEWNKSKHDALLNHLKLENYQLRVELGKARQSVPEMTQPITIQPTVAPG